MIIRLRLSALMMPNRLTRRTWTRIALLAAGAAVLTIIATSWIAVTILTAPAKTTIGNLPEDLKGRAVGFRSDSGATIRGWFLPGSKGHGIVVLMHGIRSSRSGLVSRARFLSRAGYSVLLFDFQAHGESAGDYITAGYLESRDARAAIEFARAEAPGETVGVIGISMGGAALVLADPAPRVEAVVLEMVYPTIEQAIDDRLRMRLGGLGTVLRPLLTAQLPLRYGIRAADLHPIDRVRQIRAPKLFIAGAEDVHTTLVESRELFAAAAEPKELWIVDGARHQDLHELTTSAYEERILSFFGKHLR